jgi:hypothetical protein
LEQTAVLGSLFGWLRRRDEARRHGQPRGVPPNAAPPQQPVDPLGRSLALLDENLSTAQRQQHAASRFFDVIGGSTGKRYRIHPGRAMNVVELDRESRPVATLCFFPAGRLPQGDVMLAQKMALEVFEPDTLKVAIRHPAPREEQTARREDLVIGAGISALNGRARHVVRGDRLVTWYHDGNLDGGFTLAEEPNVSVYLPTGTLLVFDEGIRCQAPGVDFHRSTARLAHAQWLYQDGLLPAPVLQLESGERVPFWQLTPGQVAIVSWVPEGATAAPGNAAPSPARGNC